VATTAGVFPSPSPATAQIIHVAARVASPATATALAHDAMYLRSIPALAHDAMCVRSTPSVSAAGTNRTGLGGPAGMDHGAEVVRGPGEVCRGTDGAGHSKGVARLVIDRSR